MIGRLDFIQSAGSLTTAEYPLIASDDEMDAYVKKTYSNVHFVEDTEQTITMPSFDGWADCNLVRFVNEDKTWTAYYWITTANRSSDVSGANVYTLMLNAPMTLLKKGDALKGNWLRTPQNLTPWKQQNIISGTMGYTDHIEELPTMPTDPYISEYGYDVYWVSITATMGPTGKQGTLELYGYPVKVKSDSALCDDSDGSLEYKKDDGTFGSFPSITEIINGETLTWIGLTTDEIKDISITRSAPYAGTMSHESEETSAGTYVHKIYTIEGIQPKFITRSDGTKGALAMYHITGSDAFPTIVNDVTMHLSAKEIACGNIAVRDTNGANIANIPTSWISKDYADYSGDITMKHQCIADFSQCYDRLEVTDANGNALGIFQIPATHLPYIGDQWDSYRAYSMSFDREAMQFGIDQARNQMLANLADSAINATVGLATGGATFAAQGAVSLAEQTAHDMGNIQSGVATGTGIVSSIVGYYQQEHAARFNQQLTERRTQAQPGNAYNVNYGLSYLMNTARTPNCIVVSMPVGLTDSMYDRYIADFGYANEGFATFTVDYGFYQGTLYSTRTLTGPRFNQLINDFNNGIRLIPPYGRQ